MDMSDKIVINKIRQFFSMPVSVSCAMYSSNTVKSYYDSFIIYVKLIVIV